MTHPTDPETIRDAVFTIVAQQAKLDVQTLRPEYTLADLGIESLTAIEVLFDVEERFDISFPSQGPNFATDTLQHLVDVVSAALGSGNGAAGTA